MRGLFREGGRSGFLFLTNEGGDAGCGWGRNFRERFSAGRRGFRNLRAKLRCFL